MIGGTTLLIALAAILALAHLWTKYTYSYWRRNNVAYIPTTPFLGSLKNVLLMKASWAEHIAAYYNHPNAKDQPILGIHIFHKPGLIIREPELVKRIMVKDFSKFSDRHLTADAHGDVLGDQNLFFVRNPKWKEVRAKLTPVFTSAKMKQMFPLITEIGKKLDSFILSNAVDPRTNAVELEIKEISASFSNDVIATVAFGVEVNSFTNPQNDFRTNAKRIFEATAFRALELFIIFFVPSLVRIVRCKVFSKPMSKFLRENISYVLKERKNSRKSRNDLIDILLAFDKEAEIDPEKRKFATEDFMVAQAAVFFTAGFETSSSTISFAVYELSKYPAIQRELREEIREALKKTGGEITYEMIHDMPLLNKVINETLRLYPTVPWLERQCTLSAGEEPYSLEPFSKYKIPNGMPTYVSNVALQRDPKYYPDPEKFDPERFSTENKSMVNPYTYLPFGTGPHNCIGERLGLIQSRVGIISYLRNHYVTTSPRSHSKIIFDHKSSVLAPIDGLYLNLVRDPLL